MHTYATDSEERHYLPRWLALASVLLALALFELLRRLKVTPYWWVPIPSVMGIYGILYWLFDTRVWRWQALSRLGVVRVPDLSGDWSGYVSSSFHEGETQHPASGRIRQSWTRIFVTLDTMQSRSRSLTGTVLVDDGSDTLAYEYLNEPRADADKRLHAHRGAARLALTAEGPTQILVGEYYSGRGRQNVGVIRLERQENGPELVRSR